MGGVGLRGLQEPAAGPALRRELLGVIELTAGEPDLPREDGLSGPGYRRP